LQIAGKNYTELRCETLCSVELMACARQLYCAVAIALTQILWRMFRTKTQWQAKR